MPDPEVGSFLHPSTWRLTWRTILIGAGLVCAVLLVVNPNLNRLTPLRPQLEPTVEKLVDDALDAMADAGESDLIDALAFPLPFTVISVMLGMPDTDTDTPTRREPTCLG